MTGDRSSIIHALNPFVPGAGRPPKELVGRTPELEYMDTIIARTKNGYTNQGLILSGLRGVGKTVLLLRLMHMAQRQGLMAVGIEATGDSERDQAALFNEFERAAAKERRDSLRNALRSVLQHIQKISLETPIVSTDITMQNRASNRYLEFELACEEIAETLSEHHSGLFIFIDEFQEMDAPLMGMLIGLQHRLGQQSLPFYIIGAGLPNLPGVLTTSRSYAERLFEYREIGRLSDEATVRCLQETVQQSGRTFTKTAVDRLIEDTKGYPYFIQAYGEATFNKADSSPIPIEAVLAGECEALRVLDHGLYESRWQRSTKQGRQYMRAMAALHTEVCDSAAVARFMHKKTQDISKARKTLIELGLIYSPERGKVAFTVPGMAEFISRVEPDEQLPYDRY